MKSDSFFSNFNNFDGNYYLVTGASSGIGRQCAKHIAEMGGTVIALSRRNNLLDSLIKELPTGKHVAYPFDLSIECSGTRVINEIVSAYAPLSGVVHAAGIDPKAPIQIFDDKKLQQTIRVNLIAALELAKGINKKGASNDECSVVFISSIAAIQSDHGHSVYSASKGGLNSAVKALALDGAKKRIRYNAVAPGMVLTNMTKKSLIISDSYNRTQESYYPLGYGKPEDVANSVIFLLSDAARWITGTVITVDGGRSAH